MPVDQLITLFLTGLTVIAVLVIASLGLGIVFGMMRVTNLAHGEFLMAGAYTAVAAMKAGFSPLLAVAAAGIVVGLIGVIVERLIIRPLYGRIIDSMLATWGLSLVMTQVAVILFGTVTTGVQTPFGNLLIGRYSVSQYSLFLVFAAVVLVLAAYLIFTKTNYGLMAQAAIQNPDMAAAIGVDAGWINMLTFGFASALAGIAGALLAPINAVTPTMGLAFIARTFLTVVVAGPIVLSGVTAAAVTLGTVQTFFSYLITPVFGTGALLITSILALRIFPFGISANWKRRL